MIFKIYDETSSKCILTTQWGENGDMSNSLAEFRALGKLFIIIYNAISSFIS